MDEKPSKKPDVKLTGRRYGTVEELLRGEHLPKEISEGVAKLSEETRVTRALAAYRVGAGLTQEEMAEKLGCTQGTISKLESGRDEDLTLGDIRKYSDALHERVGLVFGPPMNHVEAIKAHATAMRQRMLALAKLAHSDAQMETEVQAFFGEAFFNILSILATCQNEMPKSADNGVRIELLDMRNARMKTSAKTQREQAYA